MPAKRLILFPDKNLVSPDTKIIAHKGGGGDDFGIYKENSLEGAKYGFENADGIEIDIQKSRDNTLWLYHDEFFYESDNRSKSRLTGLSDDEIISKATLMGYPDGLTKLEAIFEYHHTNQLNKKISLDVKSWLPTIHSEAPMYLLTLADKIIDLTRKYEMGSFVMVECENTSFLNRIKHSGLGIECYLATMGDFKNGMLKSLKAGYTGISFRYDSTNPPSLAEMELLRKKGLKIQFWTINDKSEIMKALELKPDYLQTDNVSLN